MDRRSVKLPSANQPPSPLSEQIYLRLKEAILVNDYLPGQFLTEQEIAEAFHTSKSPVRDALKLLQAERLVTAISKRGYAITSLSPGDIRDRFFVRQVLEVAAAQLAVSQISEAGLHRLDAIVDELGTNVFENDQKGQLRHNRRFHSAVAELSGNSFLAELIDAVHNDLQRALFTDILHLSMRSMRRDHEALVEAIRSRDPERARQAALLHVEETRQRVMT